jgi:hypothetical protein
MSGRMNWRAAQLRDRASMNVKREQDVRSQDRAAKWLETAERRVRQRRILTASNSKPSNRSLKQYRDRGGSC